MRILFASHGYPPTISGVTIVVQKLARAMVDRGHTVTVVTASDRGEAYDASDGGAMITRVRSAPNPFWKEGPIPAISQREMSAVLDRVQPDVIHTHEAGIFALYLLDLAGKQGVPIVSTCHYVPNFATHYLHTFNEADSLLQNVVWTYSVRLHNRYDQVVFPTEVHRHLFVQQGLSSPAAVISNGVDTKRYRPAGNRPAEIERRYNLPSGPRILFVSRLARDKRIDVLIEAMPHVLMDRPAHLLLVGRGDDTQRLQELVASLELEDHVHFLGFVPEADLPGVYQASDLFAMASTVEVQSIPMLQALASGLPAVAVDAMALPELVHDDTNGYLVTPGSARGMARAILRILRNPERAARMGHKGLEIVRPHAEERTYTSYEQLYTGVIAGRNGKAGPAT